MAGAVRGRGIGGFDLGGMLGDPPVATGGIAVEVGIGCCPILMSVPTFVAPVEEGGRGKEDVALTAGGDTAENGLVEIGGVVVETGGAPIEIGSTGGCC